MLLHSAIFAEVFSDIDSLTFRKSQDDANLQSGVNGAQKAETQVLEGVLDTELHVDPAPEAHYKEKQPKQLVTSLCAAPRTFQTEKIIGRSESNQTNTPSAHVHDPLHLLEDTGHEDPLNYQNPVLARAERAPTLHRTEQKERREADSEEIDERERANSVGGKYRLGSSTLNLDLQPDLAPSKPMRCVLRQQSLTAARPTLFSRNLHYLLLDSQTQHTKAPLSNAQYLQPTQHCYATSDDRRSTKTLLSRTISSINSSFIHTSFSDGAHSSPFASLSDPDLHSRERDTRRLQKKLADLQKQEHNNSRNCNPCALI